MGKPTVITLMESVIKELEAVREALVLKTKEKISVQVQFEVCEDDLRRARERIRELETLLEGKEV